MIPADKVLENQYTRGNEYIDSTGKYYQGYYCVVLDSKYYTGKTYTIQSKELSKVIATPTPPTPTSLPPQVGASKRYFLKKINVFPISIKEVDEQTYNNFTNDPLYQSVVISKGTVFRGSTELDKAETQMPGLKTFLLA
jgi:hypothetical protein